MASDTIQIKYQIPSGRIAPGCLGAAKSVCLTETLDVRGVAPHHVMRKISLGGGPATGDYVSQQPLAQILHAAAEQALERAGNLKPASEADLLLSLKVRSLDFSVMVGFAQCLLKGGIQAEVILKDAKTGNLIWEGKCEGAGRAGSGNLVPDVLSASFDNFLLNLIACPGFQ